MKQLKCALRVKEQGRYEVVRVDVRCDGGWFSNRALRKLSALTSLTYLSLSGDRITDVTPPLTSLTHLKLWCCRRITDVSPLAASVERDVSIRKATETSRSVCRAASCCLMSKMVGEAQQRRHQK